MERANTLLICGILGLAPACQSRMYARDTGGNVVLGPSIIQPQLTAEEKVFLTDAATRNIAQQQLARLAIDRAQSPVIRELATRTLADRERTWRELSQMADRKWLNLPNVQTPAQRGIYDWIAPRPTSEFDRAYVQQMVADHQADIGEFTREAERGRDREIRMWAQESLPVLQLDQEMAQRDSQFL